MATTGCWSRSHSDLFSRVLHDFVSIARGIDAHSVVLAYEDYAERAAFKHARKLPFAIADGQSAVRVIPVQRNRGKDSFFVILVVIFVFIEREVAIRAAIDTQFDWVGRFLGRPFFVRAQRQDRASANE